MLPSRAVATTGTPRSDLAASAALLLALLAVVVAAAAVDVFSADDWWHLATGEWILAHRALPLSDPFSCTSAGTPWVDHEWLFQVALALSHRALGVPGMVLLRVALTLAAAILLLEVLRRRGASPAAAALLVAVAVVAA